MCLMFTQCIIFSADIIVVKQLELDRQYSLIIVVHYMKRNKKKPNACYTRTIHILILYLYSSLVSLAYQTHKHIFFVLLLSCCHNNTLHLICYCFVLSWWHLSSLKSPCIMLPSQQQRKRLSHLHLKWHTNCLVLFFLQKRLQV